MNSEQSGRPLHDAAAIRAIDRWASEQCRVPSLELMENAGGALADEIERRAQRGRSGGPIRIVCGKGNNGGDGLVAARLLRGGGHGVDVLLVEPGEECAGDAARNLSALDGDWSPLGDDPGAKLHGSGLIVDAIFGTGFSGEPRGSAAVAITAINEQGDLGASVLACDVPSGVDASTGQVGGGSVRADATVSFHAAKLGTLIAPGKRRCGELLVAPIGIPEGAPTAPIAATIGADVLAAAPSRGAASTKFSSGEVVVVGGSRGMTGAVCMAARAAGRGGAGYVTVGVPSSLESIFEIKLTEEMTVGLDDVAGSLGAAAAGRVIERAGRAAAVLIGPGVGRRPHTAKLVRELVRRIEGPMVVDADGLNALGAEPELLTERRGPTILTPHAGELARLLGSDSDRIQADRLGSARAVAERAGAVVVLKGDDTIITDGEAILVNELPAPGLATAGTGDVLAGLTVALLARGMSPLQGAAAAVYAHARAGRLAAAGCRAESVIATDVIEALPYGLDPEAAIE